MRRERVNLPPVSFPSDVGFFVGFRSVALCVCARELQARKRKRLMKAAGKLTVDELQWLLRRRGSQQ